MICPSVSLFLFVCLLDKDVLRTDREYPTYKSLTDPKIQQLEDILRTYTMYNFDLGKCHKYLGTLTWVSHKIFEYFDLGKSQVI